MKKLILAATVAALSATAQAAPTVYGRVNLSLDQVGNAGYAGQDITALNSNASRIGFKGQENLIIDFIDVVYQMEWAVSTDGSNSLDTTTKMSGTDTDLSQRNRFLGLKFKEVGTLKFGRYDTYFKTAAGDQQDIFNDHMLDFTSMLYGEERLGNVIGFESDKQLLDGFQFNIMTQLGEDAIVPKTGSVGLDEKRNSATGVSASIGYDNPEYGFNVALAGNYAMPGKYVGAGKSGIYSDAMRLTASYDAAKAGLDGLMLGMMYQTAQPTDDLSDLPGLKEDAFSVTLGYTLPDTNWKLKAEYVQADTSADKGLPNKNADRRIDQFGVGVDYQFNKKARAYAVLAQQSRDWITTDNDKIVIGGVGMLYNF